MIRKQATTLFILKIFRIPLNLLLLSLTAKYFGVSIEKDVWLLAFSAIITIDSALWGPINETFRTKFVFLKERNSTERAISDTQSLLTYFFLFSLVLMLLVILFPDFIAHLIAPNYSDQNIDILTRMLLVVAPILVLNQLVQIGISILNAYEIFFIAEFSGFVSTFINIILLFLLANNLGISTLPISYYVSTGVLLCFIIIFIIKNKIPLFSFTWNIRFNGFKTFFLFALPFFMPYFFGQMNGLIEKVLAGSISTGTVSIIDFANKIPTLMYGMVVNIITTILIPVLSKYYIKNDSESYNQEFRKIFNLGLLVVGSITAGIAAAATSIVTFLYDQGAISQTDLIKIEEMSVLYGITTLGLFIYIIAGMSLLSSEKHKYYALLGIFTQVGVILMNFTFVKWLGMYIFPVSVFLSHLIFGLLMLRKHPYRNKLRLEPKYFTFILMLIGISYFFISRIQLDNVYFEFASQISALLILFILLSFLFELEEKNAVVNLIKLKINRLK